MSGKLSVRRKRKAFCWEDCSVPEATGLCSTRIICLVHKLADEEPQPVSRKILELRSTLWNVSTWWRAQPHITSGRGSQSCVIAKLILKNWAPFPSRAKVRSQYSVTFLCHSSFCAHEASGEFSAAWGQAEQKAVLLTLLCNSFFASHKMVKYWLI